MNYKIGQILYTCNEKSLKIIPFQVIEIIVRTTIEGEKKEYIIQLPDKEKTTAPLDAIKGKIFENIKDVNIYLLANAKAAITTMISMVSDIVNENFKNSIDKTASQYINKVQVDTNNDIIMVDLGNGVKAKMDSRNLEKVVQ
jgi:hypothetical protein